MYLPKSADRRRAMAVFLAPSFIGLILFCLLPIVTSLVYSLMDYDLLAGSMKFIGFRNYSRILTGKEFLQVLGHTLTYLGLYLPFILVLSLAQGMVLNHVYQRRNPRGGIEYFWPEDVENIRGEDGRITHDVGIVFARQPFILCMCANDVDAPGFEMGLHRVAQAVFDLNN